MRIARGNHELPPVERNLGHRGVLVEDANLGIRHSRGEPLARSLRQAARRDTRLWLQLDDQRGGRTSGT